MSEVPDFIEVQKYPSGVAYPCARDQLVEAAEDSGAPNEVVELLTGLGDREYSDRTEVTKAMTGDREQPTHPPPCRPHLAQWQGERV